jgi:hypothetical protein
LTEKMSLDVCFVKFCEILCKNSNLNEFLHVLREIR